MPSAPFSSSYRVADYLFDRLAELGVTEVFGVPGDYNLAFLDVVDDHENLRWVGNANELNAAYAADAYARARGLSALVTTFGVGELSAINGIAGSYAEYAPVLEIVGAPRLDRQEQGLRLHHSLGDGNFDHFRQMHEPVTVAHAALTTNNAAAEIDRVLREIIVESRPGYLMLSPDVAMAEVHPPSGPIRGLVQTSSPEALAAFQTAAAEFLEGKRTTILADLLIQRMGATTAFEQLIGATPGVPYTITAWGKTLLDELSERFAGVYAGAVSTERARAAVEEAAALVKIGVLFNDTTTASFSDNIDPTRVISVEPGISTVGNQVFAPVTMRDATAALAELASATPWLPHELLPVASEPADATSAAASVDVTELTEADPLTHAEFWPMMNSAFTSGQTVLADQGTPFFGMPSVHMPTDALFLGQPLWGSIGYGLPACLGAGLALPERRAVLLIGDGSAQLTIQDIGTLLRENVNPIIILINNDGYTIERQIHGPERCYNDITAWNWQAIPAAFGGTPANSLTLRAETAQTLNAALTLAENTPDKLVFIEAIIDRTDVPGFLGDFVHILG